MHSQNIANLVLICLGVFVTGVSLTLLAPFYPSEALKKVDINLINRWITITIERHEGSLRYTVRGCDEYSLYCHHCLHSSLWKGKLCFCCNAFLLKPPFPKYMRTLGARNFLVIGAFFVGVGNGGMGFLDYIISGNLFFGLSIAIRILTAIGNTIVTQPSDHDVSPRRVLPHPRRLHPGRAAGDPGEPGQGHGPRRVLLRDRDNVRPDHRGISVRCRGLPPPFLGIGRLLLSAINHLLLFPERYSFNIRRR